jgi:hypothetical protein
MSEEEHEEAYDGRTEHQKLREGAPVDQMRLERERKEFLRGGNWGRKCANDEWKHKNLEMH